jgi:hypothetical protein
MGVFEVLHLIVTVIMIGILIYGVLFERDSFEEFLEEFLFGRIETYKVKKAGD